MFDLFEDFLSTRRKKFIFIVRGEDFALRSNFGTLTKIDTSTSTYHVRANRDSTLKEPYIVPYFIVGTGPNVKFKGEIYNRKDIPDGEMRQTSTVASLTIENLTPKGNITTKTVRITEVSYPEGTTGLLRGVVVKTDPNPPAWWHGLLRKNASRPRPNP